LLIDLRDGRVRFLFFFVLFFLNGIARFVSAQEEEAALARRPEEFRQPAPPGDSFRYTLQNLTYEADRSTQRASLRRVLNVHPPLTFETFGELAAFMESKVQTLVNYRVFKSVTYTLEALSQTAEEIFYEGTLRVEERWTLFPIPFIKPAFEEGNFYIRPLIKIYDYNFLGTLTSFFLGGNFEVWWQDDATRWIPRWYLNPKISGIKIGALSFSLEILHQKNWIADNFLESERNIRAYEKDYTFYSTNLSFSTGFALPFGMNYTIGPSGTFYYNYKDRNPRNGYTQSSGIEKSLYSLGISHSLGWGETNWRQNFREGFNVSLSNSYGLSKVEGQDIGWATQFSGFVTGYHIWNRLNPSARLFFDYSLNSVLYGMGSGLRGIPDSDLSGKFFLGLNVDLCVSLLSWRNVGEAQVRPFFDAGLVWRENKKSLQFSRDFRCSVGADFILYLDMLPGLVAVGSAGIDLTNPDWGDPRKYEITIESSLHY
jgi:hypothetical protein